LIKTPQALEQAHNCAAPSWCDAAEIEWGTCFGRAASASSVGLVVTRNLGKVLKVADDYPK
jgi:hypothetical protein